MSELLEDPTQQLPLGQLKSVLREVVSAGDVPAAEARLAHLLTGCDACLVAQVEDELIREGVSVEQLAQACDHHAAAVRTALPTETVEDFTAGHPVETFRSENSAIKRLAEMMLGQLPALLADGKPVTTQSVGHIREALNSLLDIEKHYLRKEHLLFTCLERHGITGPSKVMWAKDDEIRSLLRSLEQAVCTEVREEQSWKRQVIAAAQAALSAVLDMVFKEEQILLPMAVKLLAEDEWVEIWAQSPQFGWCIVDPGRAYRPSARALLDATTPRMHSAPAAARDTAVAGRTDGGVSLAMTPASAAAAPDTGAIVLPSGAFTLEQLISVFNALPVDLTFVDAEDRVRFFSEGAGRIFVRPKAVIGRKVQHCHPPKSLDKVEQILDDFRAGRQNVAEFWINFNERFVHIRYFALRNDTGSYLGTLEVTQDLTRERRLQGERRLVVYDN